MSGIEKTKLVEALETADWSGVNIGNKALILAAISELTAATSPHLKGCSSFAEMVSTHVESWREALNDQLLLKAAPDDIAFVEAELVALADIELACAHELARRAGLSRNSDPQPGESPTQPEIIGWKVEFENGEVEVNLGENEPTAGRWATSLIAGGETIDLAPKAAEANSIYFDLTGEVLK